MELSNLDGDLEILVDYSESPTVTLKGEVDYRNSERVRQAVKSLLEHGKTSITVDVRELVFMDTTGMSVIADAAGAIADKGGKMELRSPSKQLAKVLAKSGLSQAFSGTATLEAVRELVCPITGDRRDVVEFEVPSRPEMISHVRTRVARRKETQRG